MTALRGWGLPEQHLALDALVAFVDGELTPTAYDRAASHLARCPSCAADATAQRQARSAVRRAAPPSMSPQFLQSLQSIPSSAELPEQPDGLAMTEDGRLVTVNRQERASALRPGSVLAANGLRATRPGPDGPDDEGAPDDHPEPSKGHGRRAKQGAGVVFSGLVLGALAFMNVPTDTVRNTVTTVPRPSPLGDTTDGDVVPATTSGELSTAVGTTVVSTTAVASAGTRAGSTGVRHHPGAPVPTLSGGPSTSASTPAER